MFLKLLGLLDIAVAMLFVLSYLGFLEKAAILFGLYLIFKSVIFFGGLASIFDLAAGGALFLFIYTGFSALMLWLAIGWLLQKGAISLFSSS